MKINIDYIENDIIVDDQSINVIEVENKNCFYRIIRDFFNNNFLDSQTCIRFYEKFDEIDLSNKIKIYIDYFNMNYDSKKYIAEINKIIFNNVDDQIKNVFFNSYKKMYSSLKLLLNDIDLPLNITSEFDVLELLKIFKISIDNNGSLLEKILLLIDLEKLLKINKLIIFVNLKQYLEKNELEELYKYCLYNNVKILLIDSQCYGVTIKNEKKLIIAENLDEFVL